MSDRQDGDKQILARIDGALKKYDTPGLPVLNPKLMKLYLNKRLLCKT